MADQGNWISAVQGLIEACRNSQEGYRQAAEHIADPEVGEFLREQAERRAGFERELRQPIELLGAPRAAPQNPWDKLLTRAWIALKDKLRGGEDLILSALEAADQALRNHYRRALEGELPPAMAETVRRQLLSLREADDHLNLLHERRRAA